jgi:hypothetical protein
MRALRKAMKLALFIGFAALAVVVGMGLYVTDFSA